jgi:hypothetical protein
MNRNRWEGCVYSSTGQALSNRRSAWRQMGNTQRPFDERRMKRNRTAVCVSGQVFRAVTASPYEDVWGSRGEAPHFGQKSSWASAEICAPERNWCPIAQPTCSHFTHIFRPLTRIAYRGHTPNGSNIAYDRHVRTVSGGRSTCHLNEDGCSSSRWGPTAYLSPFPVLNPHTC